MLLPLLHLLFVVSSVSCLDKGPVGLDFYRQLDRLPELYSGVRTHQFSSFDRTGGNDDGFSGRHSCIRKDEGRCVIAEWLGAGEIATIWFTREPAGHQHLTGNIHIELDGKEVINYNLENLVRGYFGKPFVWTLVGNAEDTQGGAIIKVPMPFTESMRILTDHNPKFYHVTFRSFANSEGVKTFNLNDTADSVVAINQKFGINDPKPKPKGKTETKKLNVGVNKKSTKQLLTLSGSGQIRQLKLRLPKLLRGNRVFDDGRAFKWSSQFVAKVDPKNEGVRITRRFDRMVSNQKAELLVDGVKAGEWGGVPVGAAKWEDQSIDIPSDLTKGKKQLTIKNKFISSRVDFNEFRYDVDSKIDGELVLTDVIDVGPDHPGEEAAHQYQNVDQTWTGSHAMKYQLDAKAVANSDKILEQARIKITFDGKMTVDVPIGEFFGSGLGMFNSRSLYQSVDATTGTFTSWWPMPYGSNATIELQNGSDLDVSNVTIEATVEEDEKIKIQLWAREIGYFRANYFKAQTVLGRDWMFLDTRGHGVFYGVTHTMRSLIKNKPNVRNYLEGDERVYVDGLKTPILYGTGSEDFYESGWYFRDGKTYHMPLAGNPAHKVRGDECQIDCTVAYRMFAGDGIRFLGSIKFGIEHGPQNDEDAIYSSVAYWYSQDKASLKSTDSIVLNNDASRKMNDYSAEQETRYNLNSVFEGQDDKKHVNNTVTTAKGLIKFNVTVDPDNVGVRLARTSDQAVAYQCAEVTVDDQKVGRWLQPLGNQWQRWMQDAFDVPASFTKNKIRLFIKLKPVSCSGGPVHWSASRYDVVSILK